MVHLYHMDKERKGGILPWDTKEGSLILLLLCKSVRRPKWTALRNFLWFSDTNAILYWPKTINLLRVHETQIFPNSHSLVKKQTSTIQRSFSATESTWQLSFVVNEIRFLSHSLFHYFSILIYLFSFPLFLCYPSLFLPFFTHLVLVLSLHNHRIIKAGERPLKITEASHYMFLFFPPALISVRYFSFVCSS